MADQRAGDRMTALDAAFYHLERTGQLLHVGGVYTVDGQLDFERQIADLVARLPQIPRYTQRAVEVPLGLAHPTWEPDPRFDIREHVIRHVLRPPGDDEQLVGLASRLFAQSLDRHRPLWELHQIDGYRGDRSALFAKVHHCMIDGVSGVQLLNVLFDVTPNPPVSPALGVPPKAPPLPTPAMQLGRALEEQRRGLAALVAGAREAFARPAAVWEEVSRSAEALADLAQAVLHGIPATPFNGHVSVLRRVAWTTFNLNEVKAVKNRLGGTVNDVVLATISAALRGYLEAHGQDPDGLELRALVPVDVRRPDEHLALGNRVSGLLAPLPVGIFDPIERLRQVRAGMQRLKRDQQAVKMSRALDLLALLPPVLQRPLGWLQIAAAPINTVCTNIPGPPVSLYVQGRRLETLVPIVPLAQGVGLAFAILSYADRLTIGLTYDPALVHDAAGVCALLQDGFRELRTLAGVDRPIVQVVGGTEAGGTTRPVRVA